MANLLSKLFNYTTSDVPRPRWNVLDLITYINHGHIPTLITCDIDLTWAEDLRIQLKGVGQRITVTALLLKAIAIAQRDHPDTRTGWTPGGRLATFRDIVAGFTVERFIGSQPAVFFGAIDNPDTKPVSQIAEELKGYAEADMKDMEHLDVQNRFNNMPWLFRKFILWAGREYPWVRLKYMGATFGLSTLGKFGVKCLVPPCVTTSTFGVGEVEERAVVKNGQIVIRKMVTLALNFDHRVIDGAPAARFMQDVRRLMEGGLESYLQPEIALLAEKKLDSAYLPS